MGLENEPGQPGNRMGNRAVYRLPSGARQPVLGLDGSLADVDAERQQEPGRLLEIRQDGHVGSVTKVEDGWMYRDGTVWSSLVALRDHLLTPAAR